MLAGDVDSDEDFDEEGLSTVEGTSKIGKKKAEKMQAKAEKKLEREAMQKDLEERRRVRASKYRAGMRLLPSYLKPNFLVINW